MRDCGFELATQADFRWTGFPACTISDTTAAVLRGDWNPPNTTSSNLIEVSSLTQPQRIPDSVCRLWKAPNISRLTVWRGQTLIKRDEWWTRATRSSKWGSLYLWCNLVGLGRILRLLPNSKAHCVSTATWMVLLAFVWIRNIIHTPWLMAVQSSYTLHNAKNSGHLPYDPNASS